MAVFPFAGGLVSAVFAGMLLRRWSAARKAHLLAWGGALALFALASFAAAVGMFAGWSPTTFALFYLGGAILTPPVLAVGTVYLLAGRPVGHAFAALVGLAALYAAGAFFVADLDSGALDVSAIPSLKEVVPAGVQLLARVYSYGGFAIVVAGAVWSAWRLLRRQTTELRKLAVANLLIAAGVMVNGIAGAFIEVARGAVFSVGLFAGVVLMFYGFLLTVPARRPTT